ncbi:MAG: hypothetical protein KAI66_08365, partial [Lentisphaeria bacterium]|nr:hypothetical protein [Lentisphaeria bacterium]
GETDWTRFTVRAQAPPNAGFSRIDFGFKGIGSVWIDDLSLTVGKMLPPRVEMQASTPEPAGPHHPFVRVGKTTAKPKLDGLCDESMWANALALGPFVNLAGTAFPEEQTSVRVLWGEDALYIAVECREALLDPVLQRTHEVKSDITEADGNVFRDDCVELFVQTDAAAKRYYHLALNPRGTLYDASCRDGVFDKAWQSGATVATHTGIKAWTAEMAIPFASLGAIPILDTQWRFNAGRHRAPNQEHSCWAPTGTGFHNPDAFGTLAFGDQVPGLLQADLPSFEEGSRKWKVAFQGQAGTIGTVLTRYERGPWTSFASDLAPSPEAFAPTAMPYLLSRRNRCIKLDVPREKWDKTVCFRTDRLPVKAGALYRFSAMVKTEDLTKGGRPLIFSISSYDAEGTALKSYELVAAFPQGTTDWQPVTGKWQAPPAAEGILFWVVKWSKSGVTGTAWVDDMQLCEVGQMTNVIANGGVDADGDGKVGGWPVLGGSFADGYPRGQTATVACRLTASDGTLLYNSAAISGELTKEVTAIGTSLLLIPGMKDADNLHRIKELHVNEGGYLYLPLVLRSSLIDTLDGADVVLEVPAWLRLVSPAPHAQVVERERVFQKDVPLTRYRLRFGKAALTPAESDRHTTRINSLVFACGAVPPSQTNTVITLHGEVTGTVEESNEIPLQVHPPLQWKRPEVALIKHWACGSFYRAFRRLNPTEQDVIAQTWRQAGFNRSGSILDEDLRQRCGFSARGHIPLITAPGSVFPGGMEYLAEHPEARALTFEGQSKDSVFCPTYFLSEENGHLVEVREWLTKEAKHYPHLDWDYEVPVLRDGSLCVCERCLKRFRAYANLADDIEVSRTNIRKTFRAQWVDFRCRENARIAEFFRAVIKKANPDCLFSIYSGYQGTTDERYGVDWRHMAKPADLVWAGYGRPVKSIADTHAAIDGRPFIAGTLAWYGSRPWDNGVAQVAFLRRLSDGGSGIMAYFNWIVDGRFYQAISRVASIAADFESFFRWDIDDQGIYHSRYQRDDSLVRVGGEGKPEDVTVLVHGTDRLIFIFNEGKTERTFEIEHLRWVEGMACLDAETKERLGQTESMLIPPREVRTIHVRGQQDPGAVEMPRVLTPATTAAVFDPSLAWQGQGDQPGDQIFTLELSTSDLFPAASTTVFKSVPGTAMMPRDLEAGRRYSWRVRATDVLSGKTGAWSETASFLTAVFADRPAGVPAFSPNGDGVLDSFELAASLCGELVWQLRITDADGRIVKSTDGKGREVVANWDGRDGDGAVVSPGIYTCTVTPVTLPALAASTTVEVNMKVGLRNPGFDVCRGFILTTPAGKTTMTKDYAVTCTDTYALRFDALSDGTRSYWSNYSAGGLGASIIPVTPGKTYRFHAQIRSALTQGTAAIGFAFFTSNGRWAQVPGKPPWGVPSDDVTGQGDWEERQITLTAPENAYAAVLFFRLDEAKGAVWFDGVEFGETPPPE